MKPPPFVRPLTPAEAAALRHGLQATDAFTVRRCQILLASARGERPPRIAQQLSCGEQTVRNAIRAFHDRGLDALVLRSSRPHTSHRALEAAALADLQVLMHRSPREFGHPRSLWTLDSLAETAAQAGITQGRVSGETSRQAILRLGLQWKRAKHLLTSMDTRYLRKKAGATG